MIGTASATARALVRRRVEAQMDSVVQIQRGDIGAMDPVTLKVGGLANAVTVYPQGAEDGKARIHTVTGEGSVSLGEGQIDTRQVVVSIPWNVTGVPRRDDLLTVIACADDPDMVGRALRVVEVAGGTMFNDSTRLSCTMWNPSRRWTGTGS